MMRLCFHAALGMLLLLMAPLARAGLGLNSVFMLPNVRGVFGHMAVDAAHRRLFVCVTGSDTLLVLNLATGKISASITSLAQPVDVVYLPQSKRLAVSNAGNGDLDFYDADTLMPGGSITFGGDADGLYYDAATKRLYLGYGEGHASGIAIMDSDGRPLTQLSLDNHPAGFTADADAKHLYVNLPASHEIAIFNLMSNKRIATWELGIESGTNFPMALDSAHGRLFIATRDPDELLVLETRSGRVVQTLVAPGDVEGLFYNAASGELYASGGVGRIAVYAEGREGRLRESADIHTARGAGTALLDTATGRYYLAVPARGKRVAEIRVYVVTAPDHGNTS